VKVLSFLEPEERRWGAQTEKELGASWKASKTQKGDKENRQPV